MRLPSPARHFAGVSVLLAAVGLVPAASYRIPPDEVLIQKADAILRGHVERQSSLKGEDGGIYTDVTISVERIFKGAGIPPAITVRQPGGEVGDEEEVYPGIGEFAPGETVVLFLTQQRSGVYGLTDFALGKFHVGRSTEGLEYLRRDGLVGSYVLGTGPVLNGAARAAADPDRDAAAFERYIAAGAGPRGPASGYVLAAPANEASREAGYVFLGSPPARWTTFDQGGTVTITDSATGDLGSTCQMDGGCHLEVATGFSKWNNAPGTNIALVYGGPDATIGSKCRAQLANQIQFNDPCHEMSDLVNCGGTLALGGFTVSSSSGGRLYCTGRGTLTFRRISVARLLVNNGVGDCLDSCDYTNMLAHETGHMLGGGHSTDPNALMYPYMGAYPRCGALGSDDIALMQCAYPLNPIACEIASSAAWTGPAPAPVPFSWGSGGHAPLTWDYSFGDGGTDSIGLPTHTYQTPGTYTADVTVRDSTGASCDDSVSIEVKACAPPVVTKVLAKGTATINAAVTGKGFKRGAVVQIDSGGGWQSASKTARTSAKQVSGKNVGLLWPAGTPVLVRVVNPDTVVLDGCPSNPFQATR